MTIIEDANKYLHEEPTAFMTKERRLERSAVLIEKLVKEIERRDEVVRVAGDLVKLRYNNLVIGGVIHTLEAALLQLEDK